MGNDELGGVKIATAAKMLEYDKSTIRRKVEAGDLEAFGDGVGKRISLRSIRTYQNGERGIWRKEKTPTKKASTDQDQSTPMRMVRSPQPSAPEKVPSRYAGVRPRAR